MKFLPIALQRPWGRDQNVVLGAVGLESIPSLWPDVAPILMKSLVAGRIGVMNRLTVDDLYRFLATPMKNPDGSEGAAMQLFVALDREKKEILGALVTEILCYPQKRVLSLAFLGGTQMERWVDCIHDIELWAKDSGCQQVEIPGRKGWGRVFAALGYRPITWTAAKEIA